MPLSIAPGALMTVMMRFQSWHGVPSERWRCGERFLDTR